MNVHRKLCSHLKISYSVADAETFEINIRLWFVYMECELIFTFNVNARKKHSVNMRQIYGVEMSVHTS